MKNRRPLSRRLLVCCAVGSVAFCLLMGLTGYVAARSAVAPLAAAEAAGAIQAAAMRVALIAALCALALCAIATALLLLWLRRRVLQPLALIEQSASGFPRRDRKGADALVMQRVDIYTGDELESLAAALEATSIDMRDYVEELLSSAARKEAMRQEISTVNDQAHRDPVTGLRNKAAFDQVLARLDQEIENHTAEFGLLMIDLNDSTLVNATYGQDKGDLYLQNASKLICNTFSHSPVYRVGGDEFFVLLEKVDLVGCSVLLKRFRQGMRTDPYLDAWERVFAAAGFAAYDPAVDSDAASVVARAEAAMLEDKQQMKART